MSKNWHPDKLGALMAAPDRDVHDYQKHVELMLDLIVLAFQTDQTRIASFMFANSLLDNSMILFGSGMSDGNRHNPADLPILVGGRGGGRSHPAVTLPARMARRCVTFTSPCSMPWASTFRVSATARGS